jgi:hypothetical protein
MYVCVCVYADMCVCVCLRVMELLDEGNVDAFLKER